MILILSIDGDLSTDVVINWLKFYGHPYIRLNPLEIVEKKVFFSLKEQILIIGDKTIKIDEINAIWNRKIGFFSYTPQFKLLVESSGYDVAEQILRENASIVSGFVRLFKDKKWLLNALSTNINKIDVLNMAFKIGLDIPETFILSNKLDIKNIHAKTPLISKSVYEVIFLKRLNGLYSMYTNRLSEVFFKKVPDDFFPSLLQVEVKKMYEIRTFFLIDTCYSMSIFSQKSKQTELDFRRYEWANPNRFIPYKLPREIEMKIKKLMKSLNLNTGSIDFMRGEDGKYYFLEINPAGQFGMIDFSCNYGLHKKVAQTLIKFDNG
ncbi:grasp-with-spasm system ATP-grasp peptide maturase [Arcicella rosea]|uniref:ATP-GRASP peptide maturase of grasp-with-spasm system n=1 Tax=Arcicella rosea TaxID=502909 RepID=A0A841ELB8_9BACT|nr:grasp-with-spasm system ATP-grasp peptide maturase [Arcicella rosea]MBB6002209.1 ATP-GRASP peptide maturase of grasp-with-spasm system [Arcicella rosea]